MTPTIAITPTIMRVQAHQGRSEPNPSHSLMRLFPWPAENLFGPITGDDRSQRRGVLGPADARPVDAPLPDVPARSDLVPGHSRVPIAVRRETCDARMVSWAARRR